LYSEQIDNAYWNKQNTSISTNAIISPDGTQNADLLTENTTNGDHAFFDVVTYFVSGTTYTISFYAKANGRTKVELVSANSGTCPTGRFDLANVTATATNSSFNAEIESIGNGWYRCAVSKVAPNTGLDLPYYAMVQSFGTISYQGNGTSGVYFWGMQSEASSYKTSYIPTTSASATRVADACFKTGITSLIGQSEGTLFAEFIFNSATFPTMIMFLTQSNSFANAVYIQTFSSDGISFQVWSGVVNQVSINTSGLTNGQKVKVAVGYKANDFVIYVNGVQKGTDTSGSLPASLNNLEIGTYLEGGSPYTYAQSINQAVVFKTRLTNAELASLTTL
jgi:hypothetical protein